MRDVGKVMMMGMLTRCDAHPPLLAPGSPEHPQSYGDNQEGQRQLEIGSSNVAIVLAAEMRATTKIFG